MPIRENKMAESKDDKPIRVLAVDDSAVVRGALRTVFSAFAVQQHGPPRLELCGLVHDGVECLSAVTRLRPDVVVLDLEMPRMHGLDVLARLRAQHSGLPVIMCSAYTEFGARSTLQALSLGAVDFVTKPAEQSGFAPALQILSTQLMPKIVALASATRKSPRPILQSDLPQTEDPTTPICATHPVQVVVIGISTGGPSALETLLPGLPADFPVPILIAQHMPRLFTGALAERLDRCSSLRVREAYDAAELNPGTIWLAPGDTHMEIRTSARHSAAQSSSAAPATIRLHQRPSPNHCKPSVDYLFASAARVYGAGTLALVMTGMGSDGLAGARRVHQVCGTVLTQDAATSAVWGMPGRVFEAGISHHPLPLSALAGALTQLTRQRRNEAPTAVSSPEVCHPLL
jgi:two-component system chemotaxis response regulator CheB